MRRRARAPTLSAMIDETANSYRARAFPRRSRKSTRLYLGLGFVCAYHRYPATEELRRDKQVEGRPKKSPVPGKLGLPSCAARSGWEGWDSKSVRRQANGTDARVADLDDCSEEPIGDRDRSQNRGAG